MITIRICDSNRKSLENFVEQDGITVVRLPHNKMPELCAFMDKEDFYTLMEMVDDKTLHVDVDLKGPLTPIVLRVVSKVTRSGLLFRLYGNLLVGGSKRAEETPFASELSVTVRLSSHEGPVVETFKFLLLDPISFAKKLEISELWLNQVSLFTM